MQFKLSKGDDVIINSNEVITLNQSLDGHNQKIVVKGVLKIKKNGSLSNITIVGEDGIIDAPNIHCFTKNVKIKGTWRNTTTHLEWLSDDFYDINENNLFALHQLTLLNCPIEISNQYVLTGLNNREKAYPLTHDVVLSSGNKTAGFVLKGRKKGKRLFYFRGQSNIEAKNLKFTTIDFKENSQNNNQNPSDYSYNQTRYNFITHNIDGKNLSAKTNLVLNKCKFYGNISFTYLGYITPYELEKSLLTRIGFDKIEVSDCYLEEVNQLLCIVSLPYNHLKIQRNIIKNINGSTFFFPLNAKYKKHKDLTNSKGISRENFLRRVELLHRVRENATITNNIVENDRIFLRPHHYASLITAKGGTFVIRNNRIENILTKDGQNTENFSIYCSARDSLIFIKNDIKNCVNYSDHPKNRGVGIVSLLKLKKTRSCFVKDNIFDIEAQALQKLGFIDAEGNLSKIDNTKFRVALMDVSVQTDNSSNYVIQHNVFKTAYLNEHSTIRKKSFKFVDNEVEIGYVAKMPNNKWNDRNVVAFSNPSLFYLRHERNKEKLLFESNKVYVKKVEGDILDVFSYTEGSVYDFKDVKVERNVIKLNKQLNNKSIALPPDSKKNGRN